ncbi:MAG: AsmA-like C-terminal region-containing protein [Chitinophagales bacterium]
MQEQVPPHPEQVVPVAPEPRARPRWRKYLRRTLFTLLGIFLFCILAIILVPILFEGKVKEIFIRELNKNLATEVVVDQDDIQLSLYKHFPNASLVFHDVGIRESFPNSGENFLEAGTLSLVFNVWNLLRGNYTIKDVEVQDGFCTLITDHRGNINYQFWKSSEGGSASNFSINLEKVGCKNMAFTYQDYRSKQDISLQINDCDFTGNFSSDDYIMQLDGNVLSKRIYISGTSYLVDKTADVTTRLHVNVPTDKYTFENGEVVIDKNTFGITGSITLEGEDYYDLAVEGKKVSVEGLLLLLPGSASRQLGDLKSSGKITFSTTIKGNYNKKTNPAIDMHFDVQKAKIAHKKFGGELSDVSFTGTYSNGDAHASSSSYISIADFSATQHGNPVTFDLDYRNFTDPSIKLDLDGNFPAALILPLAIADVEDVEGEIALHNIHVQGKVRAFSGGSVREAPAGNVQFNGVSCKINGEKVSISEGKAAVQDNQIIFSGIHADIAGSELLADLIIQNWIQHVFPSEIKPALSVNGSITSQDIALDKILAVFSSPTSDDKKASLASNTSALPNENTEKLNYTGRIFLSCNTLSWKKLEFTDFRSDIKLIPGMVYFETLTGKTMGGTYDLDASFREVGQGDLLLEVSGSIVHLNISTLFEVFDNFDQSTLTEENIKGFVTADLQAAKMKWDKDFNLDEKSIYVLTNMQVVQGQLMDYKPMESLSGFVKMKDLRDIHFEDMQNTILIEDRVIRIPAMQIKSNALDLYLSGTHTFDNVIDYQFKLSMADIFMRKFLGANKQNDDYEEDAEGGVNVYVSMTGDLDDPVIKYNKKEAKKKLQDSGLEEHKFIDIFKPDKQYDQYKEEDKVKKDTDQEEQPDIEFLDFDDEDN